MQMYANDKQSGVGGVGGEKKQVKRCQGMTFEELGPGAHGNPSRLQGTCR